MKKQPKDRPGWRRIGSALRASAENHAYTLVASLGRLWGRPLASLMTVGVIAIALALPAGLHLALKNLRQLGDRWQVLGEISVFLGAGTDADTATRLADEIGARPDVASVRPIAPAEALADFRRHSGFDQALDGLPANPLPWVLVVSPTREALAGSGHSALGPQLEALPEVDFAQFDMEWLNRFDALLHIGRRGALMIGVLLAVAVLLIVGNTVRLELQARRPEVEISKLLGATDGFVRRPFLYLGVWYGVLGGLLAASLIAAVLALSGPPVATLAGAYQSDFRILGLSLPETAGLIGAGGAIGWLGSWIAVGRQLSEIKPG